MLQAASILLVLVIGQTFVVATGGIDLSVASTMTVAAIVLGEFFSAGAPISVADPGRRSGPAWQWASSTGC